jgi:type II secretory pathway pseudopilin PulG
MQLLVAIVILGVLGVMSVVKWTEFSRKQVLLGEGKSLLSFLQEARAYGLKKDLQVGVKFDAAAGLCTLFEDRNSNGSLDSSEAVRSMKLERGVGIGLADAGPTSGPGGLAAPVSGLTGTWTQGWIAPREMAQVPSAGAVYLRQAQLSTKTVCVYGVATSRQNQASLWDGQAWQDL